MATGERGEGSHRCPISRPSEGLGDWVLPGWQGWAHQQISIGAGLRFPPCGLWPVTGGTDFTPNHNCWLCWRLPAPADVLEIALAGPRGGRSTL